MSIELDPACRALGIVADTAIPGRAALRMAVTPDMVNAYGMVHGGYVFLLADAAFSYAAKVGDAVVVAQSAQVVFLQPAYPGDELHAIAVERSRFGRSSIVDVTVRTSNGAALAEFRGQSQILTGRAKAAALAGEEL